MRSFCGVVPATGGTCSAGGWMPSTCSRAPGSAAGSTRAAATSHPTGGCSGTSPGRRRAPVGRLLRGVPGSLVACAGRLACRQYLGGGLRVPPGRRVRRRHRSDQQRRITVVWYASAGRRSRPPGGRPSSSGTCHGNSVTAGGCCRRWAGDGADHRARPAVAAGRDPAGDPRRPRLRRARDRGSAASLRAGRSVDRRRRLGRLGRNREAARRHRFGGRIEVREHQADGTLARSRGHTI